MSNGQMLPLSELAELRTDKIACRKDPRLPYIGLEHIMQGEPVLLSASPSSASVSVNAVFQAGDILFGKLRPNLKKSLQVPFGGYCSTDILVLRTRYGHYPPFVAKVFQWNGVFEAAASSAEGTKMPRTSWDKLRNYRVFVPSPDDQVRIAAILDSLDATIARTEALIAKLKQARAGLLHDLFTRGLDERGELRDPVAHPEQFKETAVGRVPREWEMVQFGKCVISSAFGPRFPATAYRHDGNLATMRTTDMDDDGNLNLSTMPLAYLNLDLYYPHILEVGDLLISRSGTCGIAAVFTGFDLPVLPGAFLIRFRLKNQLFPEYIRKYFNWEKGRSRLLVEAEGGVQKNLKGSSLLKLYIPLPSIPEQQRVLDRLNAHNSRIRAEESYRDKLKLQKQGLMHDLLTGRVRIGEFDV